MACLTMVIFSRSCHDRVMVLTSVPWIMICHGLDKGTMANHDLEQFTMIMARVHGFEGFHGRRRLKRKKHAKESNHLSRLQLLER